MFQTPEALKAAASKPDGDPKNRTVAPCPPLWIELTVVNDRGIPFCKEQCVLFMDLDPATKIVKETDQNGVVRFDKIALKAKQFHIQLPDILEAWKDPPPDAKAGPWIPKPDDYRQHDGTLHEVHARISAIAQNIVVNQLTEAEKFAHFRWSYESNGAFYTAASPRVFQATPPRWNWGRGAVCNQHANFFLGYWFAYNQKFTTAGSATFMAALPLLTSAFHTINKIKHRCYEEFLTGVEPSNWAYYDSIIKKNIRYIRMRASLFVAKDGKTPLDEMLGTYNVYSVGDLNNKSRQTNANTAARAWLAKRPNRLPAGVTNVAAMTNDALWKFIWNLDENDTENQSLLSRLRSYVNVDHHAGILLKKDGKLYTFSADGSPTNPEIIRLKEFTAQTLKKYKFPHLALWKLQELRLGGYGPLDAQQNEGGISIDAPSRFIHWE